MPERLAPPTCSACWRGEDRRDTDVRRDTTRGDRRPRGRARGPRDFIRSGRLAAAGARNPDPPLPGRSTSRQRRSSLGAAPGPPTSSAGSRAPSDFVAARSLEEQKKFAESLALLEKAQQKDPDSAPILRALSRVSLALGKLDQAIGYSKQVIEADPATPPRSACW
ncbi:MAG: tetratricopeptide repeat protein [Isosphaeraceae bacterium]